MVDKARTMVWSKSVCLPFCIYFNSPAFVIVSNHSDIIWYNLVQFGSIGKKYFYHKQIIINANKTFLYIYIA